MNKTEQLAYDWLIGQGYTGIKYQYNKTPDFSTKQGVNFEVKKPTHNDYIVFWVAQHQTLTQLNNCTILIFDGLPTPLAIIPFSDIQEDKLILNRYKVLIHRQTPIRIKRSNGLVYTTVAKAAKMCLVSERTIYRFFDEGLPKYQHKKFSRVLIKPKELHAFLGKQR
ncbi:helix-turn-helix domain-containing protein [Patescibacteria group bacterium]|nr:helix-turn-helix domain-containing protein [Patescibacteria group bacterium]